MPVMNPLVSDWNFTPTSSAFASLLLVFVGTVELGQIVQGQLPGTGVLVGADVDVGDGGTGVFVRVGVAVDGADVVVAVGGSGVFVRVGVAVGGAGVDVALGGIGVFVRVGVAVGGPGVELAVGGAGVDEGVGVAVGPMDCVKTASTQ